MDQSSAYTKEQIQAYFAHVGIPERSQTFSVVNFAPQAQLAYLELLVLKQLTKVPFENLILHYSQNRKIDVDPQAIFKKVVSERGRGGYCMENNTLFHHVLTALGFDAYMVGAKVYDMGTREYSGFTHCLNIVTIEEHRYAVDVGFGGRGPTKPVLMQADNISSHIEPAQVRLRHDTIPGGRNVRDKFWIYEWSKNEDGDWGIQYCFNETECRPEDIKAMNTTPSMSPDSIFLQKIICVIFRAARGRQYENGWPIPSRDFFFDATDLSITMYCAIDGDSYKEHICGKTNPGKTLLSEGERLQVLEEEFHIKLSEEEKAAIRGQATEITGQ